MALIEVKKPKKYYVEDYMHDMRQEMNEMFKNLVENIGGPGFEIEKVPFMYKPAIELCEQNGNIMLQAELPGIEKEDIEVEVREDSIKISGEHKEKREEKGENIYRSEIKYGKFTRYVPLPKNIESADAKAEFKDGILRITAPKSKMDEEKIKKLKID